MYAKHSTSSSGSRTRSTAQAESGASVRERTPEEILKDFYHIYSGGPISSAEWKILRCAAVKAGVLHEAD